ncbi:DNA-formamidopyrimidine glycosylase [Aquisphaera insulae]|uniref:DNA-formamidopyrimidine glycosylase n=1 Tax=Aquisphaera insulae TaxID=2712864 RepID=UPI0013ED48E5|nr:DNA-formamidopyrimidine glycosylase [Aquisphaera insulae]
MPELPEVETMVRGLRPALEGRRIARIDVHDPSMLRGCDARELRRQGRNAVVASVGRRGKWVVIVLADHRGMIVIQPRMTGGFWLAEPARPEHVRLSIRLANAGEIVRYCDARRLGRIHWFAEEAEAERAFAQSHGPDALEIAAEDLAARLKKTRRAIKPTLMDQKVLAGIGNIYADEVLHASGIHPERVSSGLTREESGRIHAAIGRILAIAIEAEGSSFDAGYRTVLGLEGGFLAINSAYGRGGEPCRTCGDPIVKTRIAGLIGRPTYFCPSCQPRRPTRRRR